jgi:RNA polymerase sigma factor (sigma-70 family)
LTAETAFDAWRDRPNRRTLDALLTACRPILLRAAGRILRDDPHGAEDLAQDCLLRLAEGAFFGYRRAAGISGWLEQIARNAALGHLRSPARDHEPTDFRVGASEVRVPRGADASSPEIVEARTPETVAIENQERAKIDAALARLRRSGRSENRRYSRVLRAFYLRGLTKAQIAESEGIPHRGGTHSTMRVLLHRARRALVAKIPPPEKD